MRPLVVERRIFLLVAIGSALAASSLSASAAEPETPMLALKLPTVEVVGTAPLPGLETPIRDVPANVQTFSGRDISRQRQTNLGEYLEQNPTSVTINSAQGNPFQSDINYRGFTVSPVLGTPQGLSVFQDGVRINEPFGDVVNWDLIPPSAIASMQLIPGSNPVFGLNTLGGALAIHTKSGRDYPGAAIEVSAGSFGRKGTEFEYGGKSDSVDYFVTGNYLDDHGWAEHNPSTVQQLFGKIGWQDSASTLDASVNIADNTLQGTQTLPLSFLDNIRQAYTYPDQNTNRLASLTVTGQRALTGQVTLGGNLYYRKYKNQSVSSNVNDDFDPVADPVPATNDRAVIDQDGYGLGLQLVVPGQIAGRDNRVSVGTSGDFGTARFTQDSQPAAFTPDRAAIGTGDFTRSTDAQTRNQNVAVFFTDTLNLSPAWTFTIAGRYNRATVKIDDRTGTTPLLNGEHAFSRFNPAVGLNFNPTEQVTAYASYNEGMRAPTPIELACADPDAPCKLPNNFLADPALKKVLSRTVEAGIRGTVSHGTRWSAAIYRTAVSDDIQFISSGGAAVNAGYFQNVGETLREGLELSVNTQWSAFSASARYSYVNATFESAFAANSPSNSTADANGSILIEPHDHIPGIPQHSLKLRLQYEPSDAISLGAHLIYSGSVFARGDENNQDINGRVPGYSIVNLDGRYEAARDLEVFARVVNLFGRRYANFGILGQNFFNGPDHTFDGDNPVNEQFRGPGTPRGAWVGVRYRWQ